MTNSPFREVKLTPEQTYQMQIARAALMASCPFFAHYFYAEMKEVPTMDMPTAATDGRRIYYNPEFMMGLKPQERVFVLAHEVYHTIMRHPQRALSYMRDGTLRGHDWDQHQANVFMDYVINAGLVESGVGLCNPSWLYDKGVTSEALWEDVWEHKYKKPPPGSGRGNGQGSTCGQAGRSPSHAKGDPHADGRGGNFDDVLPPQVDPVTGETDAPDEAQFREAVARASAAAKAMGNMPAAFKRMVDDVLEPQINWREHLRMLISGKIGDRHETWAKPNRRRLVLNPMVILPGRRGYGAENVAIVIDNSGSIQEKELSAFFGEVTGIMNDCRPKNIILMWCDAKVQKVDMARSMDELCHLRAAGSPGGGGTSFVPPFEWLAEKGIVPETLVYVTDMMGAFPDPAPFPVIWCSSTDAKGPFGETVHIKV